MDVRDLRTFLVCAQRENFTQAAAELAYAQSTVTAQVKSLEKQLAVPLFDRVGRGVALTPAGLRLAGYARRIIALVDEAEAAVSFEGAHPHGDLTITSTETLAAFALPGVLRAFQDRYPDVHLVLRPFGPGDLVEKVLSGAASVAITLDTPVVHPDISVQMLREESVVVLAPPNHPLVGRKRLSAAALEPYRFLLSELDQSYGGAFLDRLAADGVRPADPMEFASVLAIKQCVRAGMGLTALPAFACRAQVDAGQLVILPFDCPPVQVQILSHRHRWIPPAARALMDIAQQMMSEAPSEQPQLHSRRRGDISEG